MRILALGNCALDPATGSGQTRLAWSEGLRARGHEVTVLEPRHFEWWPGLGRAKKFRQAWGAWRTVQRMDWRGYDLVEMFGDEFWLLAQWLKRQPDRPFLVAHTDGLELLMDVSLRASVPSPRGFRGMLSDLWSAATHRRFSRWAFEGAEALISASFADCDYAVRNGYFPAARARVVRLGLKPEFHGRPFREERAKRVVFVGSWVPRKGRETIVRVMSEVLRREPEVDFHIYGAGVEGAGIPQEFAAELRPRIRVVPYLSPAAMAQRIEQCAVFFFPSVYEGFGLALAEAAACGCACVTTPTGWGSELALSGNALVYVPGDVAGPVDGILSLLADAEARTELARRGWEKSQGLRWEHSVAELEALYLEWTGQKRTA